MRDKDVLQESVPGGVKAAESGGKANLKGGRMAKRKVGKHKGGRRKRHGKK